MTSSVELVNGTPLWVSWEFLVGGRTAKSSTVSGTVQNVRPRWRATTANKFLFTIRLVLTDCEDRWSPSYQGLFKVIARPSERVFTIDMRRKHINANDSYLESIDRRWDRISRNYVCNSNDYLKLRVRIPIINVFGVHVRRDFGSLEFSHECNQFEYGSCGVYVAISKNIATNIQYRLKLSRLPAQSSWFKCEWRERKITIVGWIRHCHHEMI